MSDFSNNRVLGYLNPLQDSAFTQISLSGATNGGTCAGGNNTLTATVLLKNLGTSTFNTLLAQIVNLSGGNTLISQSYSPSSVAPNANVTFTFNIQLATCNPFQLYFDVYGK